MKALSSGDMEMTEAGIYLTRMLAGLSVQHIPYAAGGYFGQY